MILSEPCFHATTRHTDMESRKPETETYKRQPMQGRQECTTQGLPAPRVPYCPPTAGTAACVESVAAGAAAAAAPPSAALVSPPAGGANCSAAADAAAASALAARAAALAPEAVAPLPVGFAAAAGEGDPSVVERPFCIILSLSDSLVCSARRSSYCVSASCLRAASPASCAPFSAPLASRAFCGPACQMQ